MKRAYLLLALVLAAVVAAYPASAAPAEHQTDSVVGDVFVCDSAVYTVTAGALAVTIHEGLSASGNENFTGTLVPRGVVVVDEFDNVYSIRGSVWFGGTVNAQQGTSQFTSTSFLNVVSANGGVVDAVRVVGHFSTNGQSFEFDFGSCQLPE
jgi:hypothetical protein